MYFIYLKSAVDSFCALALQVKCLYVNQVARSHPSQSHFYPANIMLDKEVDRKHFIQTQQETIKRLGKLGII